MQPLIAARNLTKRFDRHVAVDGVSLEVGKGEVLGFLGPNGAGKSTTMKMLTGFLAPSGGTAAICGHDIGDEPIAAKRRLGYLPEGAPLYGDMTPAAFLDFVASMRGLRGEEKVRRTAVAIGRTNIAEVLRQPIDTLSKGFKRRVGLAQALLHDPDVLILDEPTDGLDPNQKHEVRELIREIRPEKAIVISTHILDEVEAVCTRAVVIVGGRVVADDTPEGLAAHSGRRGAVTLSLPSGTADAAAAALDGLAGVERVERSDGPAGAVRLAVFPREGDITADVAGLARERGWEVRELRAGTGHLEDAFRRMTGADPLQ